MLHEYSANSLGITIRSSGSSAPPKDWQQKWHQFSALVVTERPSHGVDNLLVEAAKEELLGAACNARGIDWRNEGVDLVLPQVVREWLQVLVDWEEMRGGRRFDRIEQEQRRERMSEIAQGQTSLVENTSTTNSKATHIQDEGMLEQISSKNSGLSLRSQDIPRRMIGLTGFTLLG